MFRLDFATGNAAFADSPEARSHEIARILRAIADKIEAESRYLPDGGSGLVRDVNGNSIGNWHLSPPETE